MCTHVHVQYMYTCIHVHVHCMYTSCCIGFQYTCTVHVLIMIELCAVCCCTFLFSPPAGQMFTPSPFTSETPSLFAPSSPPPSHDSRPPPPPPHSTPSHPTHGTDHTPTEVEDLRPACITQAPPLPPRPPKRFDSISFDVQPAFISKSPTHKSTLHFSPSPHTTHPITLHTTSDSPRHHVTHVPPVPSRHPFPAESSAMVVQQMYLPPNSNPQLKNTLVQGTFSSKQKYSGLPAAIPRPLVNEAIEEAVEEEEGPRPHPVAPPEVQHSIWKSIVPGKFPAASKLTPRTVVFSRMVRARVHDTCLYYIVEPLSTCIHV